MGHVSYVRMQNFARLASNRAHSLYFRPAVHRPPSASALSCNSAVVLWRAAALHRVIGFACVASAIAPASIPDSSLYCGFDRCACLTARHRAIDGHGASPLCDASCPPAGDYGCALSASITSYRTIRARLHAVRVSWDAVMGDSGLASIPVACCRTFSRQEKLRPIVIHQNCRLPPPFHRTHTDYVALVVGGFSTLDRVPIDIWRNASTMRRSV